jgi:hypothetical protein
MDDMALLPPVNLIGGELRKSKECAVGFDARQ